MARGTVNKVILVGRLGRDPDMRYTPNGTAVVGFSIATNYNQKNTEGNWETQTEWHNITAFGRLAEFSGEYLKKGKLVYVEGSLRTRSWEDKDGQKHYRTEVWANDIQLLGSKAEEAARETGEAVAEEPVAEPQPPEETPPADADDLPF